MLNLAFTIIGTTLAIIVILTVGWILISSFVQFMTKPTVEVTVKKHEIKNVGDFLTHPEFFGFMFIAYIVIRFVFN